MLVFFEEEQNSLVVSCNAPARCEQRSSVLYRFSCAVLLPDDSNPDRLDHVEYPGGQGTEPSVLITTATYLSRLA